MKNTKFLRNNSFILGVCIGVIAAILLLGQTVYAIGSFTDGVTSALTGQPANHGIQFTTTETIDAGGRIQVRFGNGTEFILPESLTTDDIALVIDGSAKTIAETVSSGVFGFSTRTEVVSSTTHLHLITLTLPSDESIAASSVVNIDVGTHITGGQRAISNPLTTGMHSIYIDTYSSAGNPIESGQTMIWTVQGITANARNDNDPTDSTRTNTKIGGTKETSSDSSSSDSTTPDTTDPVKPKSTPEDWEDKTTTDETETQELCASDDPNCAIIQEDTFTSGETTNTQNQSRPLLFTTQKGGEFFLSLGSVSAAMDEQCLLHSLLLEYSPIEIPVLPRILCWWFIIPTLVSIFALLGGLLMKLVIVKIEQRQRQ